MKHSILAVAVVSSLSAGTCLGQVAGTPPSAPGAATPTAPALTPAVPGSDRLQLSAGAGLMTGNHTFQIGGLVVLPSGAAAVMHFPVSELDFPLDVVVGSMDARYVLDSRWNVGARLGKNLTTDAGTTTDSDWGVYHLFGATGASPASLDVYSESDTDLDALRIDADARYAVRTRDRYTLGVGFGCLYQDYGFTLGNLRQSYPSLGGRTPTERVAGKVGTYDVTTTIPYVQAVLTAKLSESVALECGLGYSPAVRAEDDAHWLLREVTFSSQLEGTAVLVFVNVSLALRGNWTLKASLDGQSLEADGRMAQVNRGVYSGTIHEEVDSASYRAALSVGRVF